MSLAVIVCNSCHLVFAYLYLQIISHRLLFYVDTILFLFLSAFLFNNIYVSKAITIEREDLETISEKVPEVSTTETKIEGTQPQVPNQCDHKSVLHSRSDFTIIESSDKRIVFKRIPGKNLFYKLCFISSLIIYYFVADFTLRPVFVTNENLTYFRLGYVNSTSIKIVYRYPHDHGKERSSNIDGSNINNQLIIKYAVSERNSGKTADNSLEWTNVAISELPGADTDYTGVYTIENLLPLTEYVIQTIREPRNVMVELRTRTAPEPGKPSKLRFGSGSCIKPNFPYIPNRQGHIQGFEKMANHTLDMMVFMGDFIYADMPIYFGSGVKDYRKLYREVYNTVDAQRLGEKTPMLHIYDDHEIINNWSGKYAFPYSGAMKAYHEYNGIGNPTPSVEKSFFYNFTYGDIAFYVLDTRAYRDSPSVKDGPHKTMLGQEQKLNFMQWIRDVNHTAAVKFVVSSVPLGYLWTNEDANQDTWRGYKHEREEILNTTKYVPNTFFLSGDRHEVAVIRLSSGNIEFSTSPINQFTLPKISMYTNNVDGDSTIYYLQPGQTKFAILEVDTQSDPNIPKVRYNLYSSAFNSANTPVYTYEATCSDWRME